MNRELKDMSRGLRVAILEAVCTYDRIETQRADKNQVVGGIMALKNRVDALAAKAEKLSEEKER